MKSIRVQILGKEYPLRVQEGHEKTMQEVANAVDSRMQAFKVSHPHQSDLVAAVISALTLAEEVLELRENSSAVLQAMSSQILLMEKQLQEALA